LSTPSILAQAVALAARAHLHQVDRSGEPYALHPIRVMLAVRAQGLQEVAQAAAVLHDVLEDTEVERGEIEDVDPDVLRLVDLVTRREWKENRGGMMGGPGIDVVRKEEYAAFIRRACSDPLSRAIKVADIRDNLSRLDKLTPENREFLTKRYARALAIIAEYGDRA
jgi:(p)ppGpp synthase/HD superfamily hydrolase